MKDMPWGVADPEDTGTDPNTRTSRRLEAAGVQVNLQCSQTQPLGTGNSRLPSEGTRSPNGDQAGKLAEPTLQTYYKERNETECPHIRMHVQTSLGEEQGTFQLTENKNGSLGWG